MKHKKRRRLKDFDYSSNGAYFITFCTFDKVNQFWTEDGFTNLQDITLSSFGKIMQTAIENIPSIYPNVSVDQYVIMPNHVHILFTPLPGQTASSLLRQWKGVSAHELNTLRKTHGVVWQKESWDTLVRGPRHFQNILTYIHANDPANAWSVYG